MTFIYFGVIFTLKESPREMSTIITYLRRRLALIRRVFVSLPTRVALALILLTSLTFASVGVRANQRLVELQRSMNVAKQAQILKDAKELAAKTMATQVTTGSKSSNPVTAIVPTPQTTNTPNQTTSTAAPVIKYSTSPDPRSTSYSTTPATPSPADFETDITHNGQVTPGTLIAYDAEKYGAKTYYGGDLVFSSDVVTYSASMGSATASFTVSTPDGDQADMPSEPWNDQSSFASVVTSGTVAPSNTWTMFIQVWGKPTPQVAPYVIHLQTFRLGTGNDAWEYDGFISMYVDN